MKDNRIEITEEHIEMSLALKRYLGLRLTFKERIKMFFDDWFNLTKGY